MRNLLDCTILVGLSFFDQTGTLIRQQQYFGRITDVNEENGITITTDQNEILIIPPGFDSILDAPRGNYECLSSGTQVVNPDLLTSWLVKLPEDPEAEQDWKPNESPFFQSMVPKEWRFSYIADPEHAKWLIETKGEHYLGKHLLIGINYYEILEGEKKFIKQVQLHGCIKRVNMAEGIVVDLGNGKDYKLPPDLSLIQAAPEGEYRLRSTGEVVVDPDFIIQVESVHDTNHADVEKDSWTVE